MMRARLAESEIRERSLKLSSEQLVPVCTLRISLPALTGRITVHHAGEN